ncbi:hypothetical protein PIB30_112016, partial [Stylosanthes scabra]|nr:hypothetical protein [Stylosanthes scabra]
GNRRDKLIIEFDPEIERTLKKNRNRVRTQRSLQFDREEASSEEVVSEKSFEEEIVEESIEEEIQDNMQIIQIISGELLRIIKILLLVVVGVVLFGPL